MAWDDFEEYRQAAADIDAMVAASAIGILDAAPPGGDQLAQYLPDATAEMVELFGQASRDAAQTYVSTVASPGVLSGLALGSPDSLTLSATKVALWALTDTSVGEAIATEIVLPKLYGGMSRLARAQGRLLVDQVIQREPEALWAQRIPRAGACSFCRMLSTRTYDSEAAAGTVVGRDAGARGKNRTQAQRDAYRRKHGERRKVLRGGGKQALGSKFHSHCKCEVYVQRRGEPDGIPAETHDLLDTYYDEYYSGVERAQQEFGVKHPNTTQILAGMRMLTGAK